MHLEYFWTNIRFYILGLQTSMRAISPPWATLGQWQMEILANDDFEKTFFKNTQMIHFTDASLFTDTICTTLSPFFLFGTWAATLPGLMAALGIILIIILVIFMVV